jgi:hypothetical protein
MVEDIGPNLVALLSSMLIAIRSGFPDSAGALNALEGIDERLFEIRTLRPQALVEVATQLSHVAVTALVELERQGSDLSAEEQLDMIALAYGCPSDPISPSPA